MNGSNTKADLLTQWTQCIEQMLRLGSIKSIETDQKTLDHLWFLMSQRDIRRTASKPRPEYGYIEIMGVSIEEKRDNITKG